MKQRFGIAQALLANPRLIIVDEPTAGLDQAERNRFLNLLSSIGRDVTVILSTHIVDDVRELCPRMAIIAGGQLLLEGARNDTLAALDGQIWSRVVSTDDELRALESELNIISKHLVGGQHEIRVFAPAQPRPRLPLRPFRARGCVFPQPCPSPESLAQTALRKEGNMPVFWEFSPSSYGFVSRAFPPTSTSGYGCYSPFSVSPHRILGPSALAGARSCLIAATPILTTTSAPRFSAPSSSLLYSALPSFVVSNAIPTSSSSPSPSRSLPTLAVAGPDPAGQYVTLDVNALVQAWVTNHSSNNGWR